MASSEKGEEVAQVEAPEAPQGYQYVNIDPVVQRRVVRKLDWNLIPLVMALYLVSFLDRSNIGNAQTAGLSKGPGSIHETDAQYQWLLTLFYIPYILFEWMALMWKVVPPHIWAFCTVFTWGVAATLQAAAFNWSGMMACRFFMAVAEAGYGPGLPYLLSFFYMRSEIGLRCGIFLSAAPFATCFAGALAYGITSGHSALTNWKLLFLVEGLPSILMAFVAWFFLPDSPEKARFLDAEEKEVARARAIRQVGQESGDRVGGINFKEVGLALIDIKNWLTALMYFSCNVSFSSLPVFLPTILTGMGFTSIHAQGLTAPPYFISFLTCIITTWIADRTRQRGLVIITLSIIGGVGYVILATCHGVGVRYFAIFLAAIGVFPAISNILPWVLNNQGTDTKRGTGMALLQMVGQCGPILGTRIFPSTEGPYYVKGMSICAGFMFFNGILALILRTYLDWQNKLADKREAEVAGAMTDEKTGNVAVENEGFGFRNIL
jgi:MFS family permease